MASLLAQMVKNLPAMQETQIWFLSWENPLEKRMATHSSILVWRIPWTEEPGGLQSIGLQRVGHDWATDNHSLTQLVMGFPGGSMVKNRSAVEETRVWSLGWEDPPEKEMATHSSVLAWEIPWTEEEEPGGLQSTWSQKSWIWLSD